MNEGGREKYSWEKRNEIKRRMRDKVRVDREAGAHYKEGMLEGETNMRKIEIKKEMVV